MSKWFWIWPDGSKIEPLGAHPRPYIDHLLSTGWRPVGETNLDRDPFPEIVHFMKPAK